ncbi:uncharacterized protein BDR25DRAFT_308626 [Lindgomyces ingoldianus]|uniref:Uncharacterized protein n=1 Tax=Lindgomyces ingoldianus TaxID=673940 RepID=A0ACB6REX5_9PLEO|nr:uncharacterized protein BDR25DRAFT_308626 [Lindgomyces ingoldianus]KAF2477751.1 hypothetical protein BDR25DRAFT_308626 [Lindgomyces ingoldianus]
MKLTTTALLFLPLALSSPITSPNPLAEAYSALQVRDKYCNFHPTVSSAQGCDEDRWNQKRKRTVQVGERFGVRCWSEGKCISGNCKWDYIPGWDCWISAHWTNDGCEDGVPHPC